ncbi:hypothetical protein O3M35_008941 [Rhynocoris fuscipes]|uniref:Uncharacterized protein n=1 Tax=Rhynocoris fuscipes TaxID=488301 RepID=A0AAW1D481_9HEMI
MVLGKVKKSGGCRMLRGCSALRFTLIAVLVTIAPITGQSSFHFNYSNLLYPPSTNLTFTMLLILLKLFYNSPIHCPYLLQLLAINIPQKLSTLCH